MWDRKQVQTAKRGGSPHFRVGLAVLLVSISSACSPAEDATSVPCSDLTSTEIIDNAEVIPQWLQPGVAGRSSFLEVAVSPRCRFPAALDLRVVALEALSADAEVSVAAADETSLDTSRLTDFTGDIDAIRVSYLDLRRALSGADEENPALSVDIGRVASSLEGLAARLPTGSQALEEAQDYLFWLTEDLRSVTQPQVDGEVAVQLDGLSAGEAERLAPLVTLLDQLAPGQAARYLDGSSQFTTVWKLDLRWLVHDSLAENQTLRFDVERVASDLEHLAFASSAEVEEPGPTQDDLLWLAEDLRSLIAPVETNGGLRAVAPPREQLEEAANALASLVTLFEQIAARYPELADSIPQVSESLGQLTELQQATREFIVRPIAPGPLRLVATLEVSGAADQETGDRSLTVEVLPNREIVIQRESMRALAEIATLDITAAPDRVKRGTDNSVVAIARIENSMGLSDFEVRVTVSGHRVDVIAGQHAEGDLVAHDGLELHLDTEFEATRHGVASLHYELEVSPLLLTGPTADGTPLVFPLDTIQVEVYRTWDQKIIDWATLIGIVAGGLTSLLGVLAAVWPPARKPFKWVWHKPLKWVWRKLRAFAATQKRHGRDEADNHGGYI